MRRYPGCALRNALRARVPAYRPECRFKTLPKRRLPRDLPGADALRLAALIMDIYRVVRSPDPGYRKGGCDRPVVTISELSGGHYILDRIVPESRGTAIRSLQPRDGRRSFVIPVNSFGFTFLLGVYAALPALSIDISTPTFSLLPKALATSSFVIGLTLSLFMVGFALGQMAGGISSDRAGRKPVLLIGLLCYVVASIACAFTPSGPALVMARFIQGIGAGSCSVLAFAIVQDLFEGDAARIKRAYVSVVFGAAPILAPTLGSLLSGFAGWRSVYDMLGLLGVLLLLATWFGLAESGRIGATTSGSIAQRLGGQLWEDAQFVRLALANALSYGVIFAYISGSPIVIMNQMGWSSSVFAGVFACTAAALTSGAWTNGWLTRRGIASTTLLRWSVACAVSATVILASLCAAGVTAASALLPLLMITLFTRGIIAPNVQHLAMERHPQRAGTASAGIGTSQLLGGALASAAVAALLPHFGINAVATPMALLATMAAILFYRRGS